MKAKTPREYFNEALKKLYSKQDMKSLSEVEDDLCHASLGSLGALDEVQKIFHPYARESLFFKSTDLYGNHNEVLFSHPYFQKSNVYMLVETRRSKLLPEKCTINKKGKITITFSLDSPLITKKLKTNLIEILYGMGNSPPNWQKIVGVKSQENYLNIVKNNKEPTTLFGALIDKYASDENHLAVNLYCQDRTIQLPISLSNILGKLNVNTGETPKIIYIGKSKNLRSRLLSHEKVQRALAEASPNKEILIYTLTFEEKKILINPEISGNQSLESLHDFSDIDDHQRISLIEMALINYFKPKYNTEYKNTQIVRNSQVKRLLKDNGYTSILINIDLSGKPWFFRSDQVTEKENHIIYYNFKKPKFADL